ncbi:hypothetical protein KO489_03840 [Reinekea forsetii]|nr:hypothetical protein [Reinekea forsetii]
MKLKLFLFLTIVILLVIMAVMYDMNRDQPWDSGVFFSAVDPNALTSITVSHTDTITL